MWASQFAEHWRQPMLMSLQGRLYHGWDCGHIILTARRSSFVKICVRNQSLAQDHRMLRKPCEPL